jgi:hypothetical protein
MTGERWAGRDGKLYPAAPLTREQRARAVRLTHQLVHVDGYSIRSAQWVMSECHGLRRSVGVIARDLADFTCPHCAT